jgi:hypothetical protein
MARLHQIVQLGDEQWWKTTAKDQRPAIILRYDPAGGGGQIVMGQGRMSLNYARWARARSGCQARHS